MKLVKHSQSTCSFCLKKVREYFTNPNGRVICKSCVELATETFKEKSEEINEPD